MLLANTTTCAAKVLESSSFGKSFFEARELSNLSMVLIVFITARSHFEEKNEDHGLSQPMTSIGKIMKVQFECKKARGRGNGDDAQRKREMDLSVDGYALYCKLFGKNKLSDIRERRTFIKIRDDKI